jgi:hypothetical protein
MVFLYIQNGLNIFQKKKMDELLKLIKVMYKSRLELNKT